MVKILNSRNFKTKKKAHQISRKIVNSKRQMRRKCSTFCWKHKNLQFSIKSFLKKLEIRNPAFFTKKHKTVWKSEHIYKAPRGIKTTHLSTSWNRLWELENFDFQMRARTPARGMARAYYSHSMRNFILRIFVNYDFFIGPIDFFLKSKVSNKRLGNWRVL